LSLVENTYTIALYTLSLHDALPIFDYILPKGKPVADQSLGHFFRRRFGDELVEHLIEPLLSGIYSGDIDEMSLMATFPNFYHLEDRKSTRLNSSHVKISYAVFCLKK